MVDPKLVKFVKRYCIHESGHAVLAHQFDTPIHFIEMKVRIENNTMIANGLCEHDMKKFIEDLGDGNFQFKSHQVFIEYLIIMWGGMAAEIICYPSTKSTDGAKYDLNKINKMIELMPQDWKTEDIMAATVLVAKDYISENRKGLGRLAEKLFFSLYTNNLSIKMDGSKVMEILLSERR